MTPFDVSRHWLILAEASGKNAADELAYYITLLRERAGLGKKHPLIKDAAIVSPPDSVPIIILNAPGENLDRNGFTWRVGNDRIELYGDSLRGLWNAVFDFLAALGFTWPKPGVEEPPAVPNGAIFPLKNDRSYTASAASPRERRRLFITQKNNAKERAALIRWAAQNKIDALVFSLGEKKFWAKARQNYFDIDRYALITEAGGGDISLLLPRNLFFFHRALFRMEKGKRAKRHHFCPTNPETTRRIMEQAGKLFSRAAAVMTPNAIRIFHLRPEAGFENTWCSCPACRAFSPAEQYRIAVDTAADALAKTDPEALLLFTEIQADSVVGIAPRRNSFLLADTV